VISEFMASNQTTSRDDFGDYSDWLELHNTGASAVNLQGWSLTDDSQNLSKWQFPAVTLQPDQFLLVRASDRDRTNPNAPLHANFKLSNEGEYLGLVRPDGATVEFAYAPQYPTQATDVSFGLSPDGQERGYFLVPTPGQTNTMPIPDSSRAVVISELMYSLPRPTILDAEDTSLEFLELHNRGLAAVNVTGWQLTRGCRTLWEVGPEHLVTAAKRSSWSTRTAPWSIKCDTPTKGSGRREPRGRTIGVTAAGSGNRRTAVGVIR
jgi:hypothetical protein